MSPGERAPARRRAGRRSLLRRGAGLAAAALLAVPLLAACGAAGDDSETASGTEGKTDLLVAVPSLPTTFAPDTGNSIGAANGLNWSNLHGSLLRYPYQVNDESGLLQQNPFEFEPMLAESYEASPDGLTYTFHLRDGVISAAGNPLTADDVVWSWQRKIEAPTAVRSAKAKAYLPDLTHVRKIDDMTVSFTITDTKYSYTLLSDLALSYSGVVYDSTELKKHVTAQDPFGVEWTKTNYNFGFGPYEITSLVQNQQMVWTARPEFVLGEPEIKTITFRPVASAGTRNNTLRSGDVDLSLELLPTDQAELLENDNIQVLKYANPNQTAQLTMVTTKEPFDDVRVRQALAYAIPYDQILDNVYHGLATKAPGMVNTMAPGYDPEGIVEYTYDPEKAKQLLAEAGFPDGVTFPLAVSNEEPDSQAIAVQMQSFAKDAGFTIEIDQQPAASYQKNFGTYTYTAFLWRNAVWNQEPASQLVNYYGTLNYPNYKGEPLAEYEALVNSSYEVENFTPEAGKIWREAENEFLTTAPMIFIANVQPLFASKTGLNDIAFRYDGAIDFSTLSW